MANINNYYGLEATYEGFSDSLYDNANAVMNSYSSPTESPLEESLYINVTQICNTTLNLSLISYENSLCNKTISDNYSRADFQDIALMERTLSIVVPILFGIIVIVGLFGNALV
jgi:hypothetical protein